MSDVTHEPIHGLGSSDLATVAVEVLRLRAEVDELRRQLASEVRTRRLVVVDDHGCERIVGETSSGKFADGRTTGHLDLMGGRGTRPGGHVHLAAYAEAAALTLNSADDVAREDEAGRIELVTEHCWAAGGHSEPSSATVLVQVGDEERYLN